MYAIATYRTPDGSRVPTAGGTSRVVINDLKTLNGVHARALRLAGRAGRGHLFGFEVWRTSADKYGTPEAVYTVRNLDGHAVRVRQYLPLETLAERANAAPSDLSTLARVMTRHATPDQV